MSRILTCFLLLYSRAAQVSSTTSTTCNSLPSFENLDQREQYFYFGCSCSSQNRLGGQFSLAGFAHNLSQWISDSSLVVDFRDCWSIDIVFDQELLYLPSSHLFRPDINILEINIENIDQVQLVSSPQPGPSDVSQYRITKPLAQVSVRLYDVSQVLVEADVHLDHLETEDLHTRLHIINSSQSTNHDFTLQGFSQENILFITDSPHPHHNLQQVSEFQSLLQQIGDWVRSESQEMSLWLSISVFLLSIGIGTMIISLIKRHRLALEAAVYSSIGSLKRLKRKSSVPRSGGGKETRGPADITTATEVAFFPRYSVVNKSWRGEKKQPRSGRAEKAEKTEAAEMTKKEKSKNKTEGKVDKPGTVTVAQEINKNTTRGQISKSSLYEIISTMKMKSSAKTEPNQKEEKKKSDPLQTSFYHYQSQGGNVSSASSKYDLTMARNKKNNVQVQVHQPNYVTLKTHKVNLEVETEPKSSSPQPLLSDSAEKIYSFNSLREKCRKMIANSKPFQSKTKL